MPNVLTFDMGGTSTDVALCRDGEDAVKREAQLGYFQFQARGADVHSVGRRRRLDRVRELGERRAPGRPASAGADPGPPAYGRGGEEPTVTDANVVLAPHAGRRRSSAGTLAMDEEAAREAVATIAEGLGIDTVAAAQAIIDIANENMHAALRVVSRRARLRPEGLRARRVRRRGADARQRAGASDPVADP